jgi:hypothetical protein
MGKKRKHDSPVVPIDPLGGNTQNFELIVIGKHAENYGLAHYFAGCLRVKRFLINTLGHR